MAPKFQLLGTGNAFLPQGRHHSLLLIDDKALVDCPPTALTSLREAELSPAAISTILFTHWHGDHYFGFPFLLLERKYISDREANQPLDIHLPSGGGEKLAHLCDLAYPGSLGELLANTVGFHEEDSGRVAGLPEWSFERFEVFHDEEVDPHGYLFTHSGGFTLMHSGDTGPCEAISSRARACDVVVIEMGIPDGVPSDHHFSPARLRSLAESCVDTTFIITHTYLDDPSNRRTPILTSELPSLPENCLFASDGMAWNWVNGELKAIEKQGF